MKTCSACNEDKPETEFNWKKKDVKRHARCKECTKKDKKRHYVNNRDSYITKQRKINIQKKLEIKSLVFEHLTKHPCVDCGEDDIRVLDFDHLNPNDKRFNISDAHRHYQYSIKKVNEEIAKCDVRCANCHRIRHWELNVSDNSRRLYESHTNRS